MSPPSQPSFLEREEAPLGWEGAHFPLSKPLLSKLAGDSLRKSTLPKRSRDLHTTTLSPRSYGRHAANMRLLSKSRKGWSFLSIKIKDGKARKGELAPELVDAIWGTQIPLESFRNYDNRAIFVDPESEIKKIRAKKHHGSAKIKAAESLMDVLLQNWTYFEHAHGQNDVIEKHVHAKYCENEFGHFLLSGNQHIHGQFYVHLHFLVSELRVLLSKLRSEILPTHYQELPVWSSPKLEEAPELEIPRLPSMPQLYPIEGLIPVPSEEDVCIPSDLEAPVFKPSIPKKHPLLILPEPLKVPPLKLPIMAALAEDESNIDHSCYKEEPLPVFVLPHQDPLPVWVEPILAELPQEPEYLVPEVIPPPVQEPIPSFRMPLMDPRPCEKAFYDLGKDERGICDGLCSKHGRKHHFVPGYQRREPCFARPPPLLPLPASPFLGADAIPVDSKDIQLLISASSVTEDFSGLFAHIASKSWMSALPIEGEPSFEPPSIEATPLFQPPVLIEEPIYVPPPSPRFPPWKEPKPPAPLGWLAGQRPVFLIDCGAAMAGERMEAVQRCLRQLFSPGGQILEFLRQQAQMQGGNLIPIHTIGLRTSKPKSRFLKRLSAVTGGHFLEYDYKQVQKLPDESEEMQDMLWAQAMIEAEQRKNAVAGRKEDLKEIIERVEIQYEPARLVPRKEAHERRLIEQQSLHQSKVETIRNENIKSALQAREYYEKLIADISERNAMNYENAKEKWEREVEDVRLRNKLTIESFLKWRQDMDETVRHNEEIVSQSKKQFSTRLKEVEAKNTSILEKAEEQYRSEVDRIKKRNRDAVEDVTQRQKELDEKITSINRAFRQEYEAALDAVQASNSALLSRTQFLYEEQLAWVKARNAKAIQDAQTSFAEHCDEVRAENARKKVALAQRLEDIKKQREEAIAAHQVDVARAIAEHGEMAKKYGALNLENETRARMLWQRACDEVDKQNNAADKKAQEDFELEQIYVQEENIKLAERRLAVKQHIAELVKANEELERRKKVEWKVACAEVEGEYERAVARSKEMHKRMVEEVKLRNAEKLQSSLVEHKAKVAAVESYNETVRPYVEASNAVRAEIRRIEAFLRCIADGVLPQDRHILEKNAGKSAFESDLDLLQVSEVTLDTDMLIEALRSAYGKNLKTSDKRMSQKKLSTSHLELDPMAGDLSAFIPVSPVRAPSHNCLDRHQSTMQGMNANLEVHSHSRRVTIKP